MLKSVWSGAQSTASKNEKQKNKLENKQFQSNNDQWFIPDMK